MVMAVKRLEPSAADRTAGEVVLGHDISLRLHYGSKERAVLFHPKYYITTYKP